MGFVFRKSLISIFLFQKLCKSSWFWILEIVVCQINRFRISISENRVLFLSPGNFQIGILEPNVCVGLWKPAAKYFQPRNLRRCLVWSHAPKAPASDGILFLAFHGLGFRVKGGGGVWGGALTPIIFLFKLFSSAIVSDPGQGHEVPKVRCDATGYGDKVLNVYNVYNVNNVLVPGEGHGLMH